MGDSVSSGGRSVSMTGAALLVLLAVLVHVLACAHGPTPTADARTDTFLTISSAGPQPPVANSTAEQTAPAHDNGTRCSGLDEPTVQAPRALTVETVHETLVVAPVGAQLAPRAGPLQVSRSCLHLPSGGQLRARLGVWRT